MAWLGAVWIGKQGKGTTVQGMAWFNKGLDNEKDLSYSKDFALLDGPGIADFYWLPNCESGFTDHAVGSGDSKHCRTRGV